MQLRTLFTSRRILFCIALVLSCIILSACTNTNRLGYKFLDWYIYWKVERFVSLDSAQKKSTKVAIKTFHAWHRQTQLPLYANYIENLQARISASSFTSSEIHDETDKVQELMDLSLAQIITPTAKILGSLNNKQVIEIIENIDEEREEFVEEYIEISDKKRLKQHNKDVRDFFAPWLGSFTKKQKQLVTDWAKNLEPFEQLSATQQELWRNQIKGLLDNRADQQALQKGLQSLMFYRTDNWNPELEAVLDRNQERSYQLVADILNSLTSKQSDKLKRRLTKFRADFLYLAARGVTPIRPRSNSKD